MSYSASSSSSASSFDHLSEDHSDEWDCYQQFPNSTRHTNNNNNNNNNDTFAARGASPSTSSDPSSAAPPTIPGRRAATAMGSDPVRRRAPSAGEAVGEGSGDGCCRTLDGVSPLRSAFFNTHLSSSSSSSSISGGNCQPSLAPPQQLEGKGCATAAAAAASSLRARAASAPEEQSESSSVDSPCSAEHNNTNNDTNAFSRLEESRDSDDAHEYLSWTDVPPLSLAHTFSLLIALLLPLNILVVDLMVYRALRWLFLLPRFNGNAILASDSHVSLPIVAARIVWMMFPNGMMYATLFQPCQQRSSLKPCCAPDEKKKGDSINSNIITHIASSYWGLVERYYPEDARALAQHRQLVVDFYKAHSCAVNTVCVALMVSV